MFKLLALTPPDDLVKDNSVDNSTAVGIAIAVIFAMIIIAVIIYSISQNSKEKKEFDEIEQKLEEKEALDNLPATIETETTIEKKQLTDEDVENLKKYKELLDNGIITQEEYEKVKNQTLSIDVVPKNGVRCPKCGNVHCQIINEVETTGKDYDASDGCCGYILLGPIGLLCGACGEGKKTTNTNYWVCNKCGNKWKV